jgi:hypothetical protein
VSTDENNMGGLFVRKLSGAAGLALQAQKIIPVLFHPSGVEWAKGHFRPLMATSIICDVLLAAFYAASMGDLQSAGAAELPMVFIGALLLEAAVFALYLMMTKVKRGPAIALTVDRDQKSLPSRTVARTVSIVSSLMALVAGRDLFFPGKIIDFIPRDDIYLEWTNAFLHSPPRGSVEADTQGFESGLFVGDKFASQLMAVHVLLMCLSKFASSVWVRLGTDGRGKEQARLMWTSQCVGSAVIFSVFRLFTPAAGTASLDLRWHLMCLAYEAFVLGTYVIIINLVVAARCLLLTISLPLSDRSNVCLLLKFSRQVQRRTRVQ